MQSMSDNELDNLFKEAAEGFTPPQDESAWKQMASMLDQHAVPTSAFWNWKTISSATAIALIGITAFWYALTPTQQKTSKIQTENGANNATQSVVQEQKEQQNSTGQKNLATAQSLEGKVGGTRSVKNLESTPKIKPTSKQKQIASANDGIATVRSSSTERKIENSGSGIVGKESSGEERIVEERIVEDKSNINVRVTREDETKLIAVDSIQEEVKESLVDTVAQDSETAEKKEKVKIGSGVSLKAIISPDFSSVGLSSGGKPGINYGLLVGYSFNNRWSVYTGVISSKKLYTSTDIEQSYSSGGHNYPVKELEGDCRILDIPVNVYYTFFPERSFSLRAGLGFSSYIMRKENYVYCVDNYGNDVYYEQQVEGKNNEWFKVMNVSVMVAKKLTPRFSAEFEPFVKAPLAGVGEGKVSLVSTGAFLNLKFDLTSNK